MQRTTLSSSATAEIMITGMCRRRVVGLQALEHLVAVHLGHHDVEQDQIERPARDQLERLAAVGRDRDVLSPRA